MNVWTFTGNIGRDAEQRFTTGGSSVVSFPVAVTSGWGDRKVTTWVKCSMWGSRGESVLPYLNKGQQVVVSGEATLQEYDKKDGSKGHSMELRVNDVTLVGGKTEASSKPEPEQSGFRKEVAKQPPADMDSYDEDDIPF